MQPIDLIERFRDVFGAPPDAWAQAPGRVNLIGEHVDYNDGLVLPMAINREVQAAGRLNRRGVTRIHSVNFDETVNFDLATAEKTGGWSDYPVGVARELLRQGIDVPGIEIALFGNVPLGSGLSSSAALEVAAGTLINALTGEKLSPERIALAAQKAEHDFVGTHCGIMDQFASALCRKGHLLLLDCRSLETRQVPFSTEDVRVVVFDTKVERRLANSAYNERRDQCAHALDVLRRRFPGLSSLRDANPDHLREARGEMGELPYRRAKHVVEEIARVRRVATLLGEKDFEGVGELLNRSHESLRDLYEVSREELEIARGEGLAIEGVLGGRLTGAGFGGCLVFLVHDWAVDRFARHVHAKYEQATGLAPEIYVTGARGGATHRTVYECVGESGL